MSTKTRVGVKVRNGNLNKALGIFNKKVDQSGILYQYKDNQEYTKPSKQRREAKKQAIYKQKSFERKNSTSF